MRKKVILLTGGTSKLGKTLATHLSSCGYVVYSGQRKPKSENQGTGITPIELDLTSDSICKRAVEKIIKKHKNIDVLIHVAGITHSQRLDKYSDISKLQEVLDVNLIGIVRLNNLVLPHMMRNRSGGRLIQITSLCGLVPLPYFGFYSSSKFGAEALGLTYHWELLSKNIKVTNIAPGAIEFEHAVVKEEHQTLRKKFPILQLLLPFTKPTDIAIRIENLIHSDSNPQHVLIGADTRILTLMYNFMPAWLFQYILKAFYHL